MTNFLLDRSIFSRLLNPNPQWGKGRCVLIYLLQKWELALKKFKASKERKKHPITLAIYFKLSSVICHWDPLAMLVRDDFIADSKEYGELYL